MRYVPLFVPKGKLEQEGQQTSNGSLPEISKRSRFSKLHVYFFIGIKSHTCTRVHFEIQRWAPLLLQKNLPKLLAMEVLRTLLLRHLTVASDINSMPPSNKPEQVN